MKKTRLIFSFIFSFIFVFSLTLSAHALHGDVNNDEYIGIEDALITLRFATGIETPDEYQEHAADLDYDGEITTNDVRLIMRGAADMDYVPDHFFSNWETIKEPTCIEDGFAESTCYYCEKKVTKVLAKTGHSIVPATCHMGSYCSVCNESFSEPLEHIESEGYCINCKELLASPILSYKNQEIKFGCSTSQLKNILGEPQSKGKDSEAEKTAVMYAYYSDYKDLAIFTFVDGKLTQFYSISPTAKVTQGSTHYGLYCKSAPEKIGDIIITTYADTLGDGLDYGFCATVGEGYNLKKTTSYSLNSKINFHLINGLRAVNNIKPLEYCTKAEAVATAHSNDMATRNYFNHESPEGIKVGTRLTEGGVEWYACGENIAAGVYDPYALANGWYNSEGHRKNILNKGFKYLGIGFAYNQSSGYKYYSTQNFYTDEY